MSILSDINKVATNSDKIVVAIEAILTELQTLNKTQTAIAADVRRIADAIVPKVVGIEVVSK